MVPSLRQMLGRYGVRGPGGTEAAAAKLFADSAPAAGRANYLRFRLSPNSAIALAARVKRPAKSFVGDQRELYLLDAQPNEEPPYERLLGDAMAGDGRCSPVRTRSRPPGRWSTPS